MPPIRDDIEQLARASSHGTVHTTDIAKLEEGRETTGRVSPDEAASKSSVQIALLTPYTGSNLGDAAIQDAVIANLRLRIPDVQFSGVSLNGDNFLDRHGQDAFPLCAADGTFYRMHRGKVSDAPGEGLAAWPSSEKVRGSAWVQRALRSVPLLFKGLKAAYGFFRRLFREARHCAGGYHFLRTKDLLIVSGGGQFDEEWGGPWGHPFTLFKWAVLARMAGVTYAVASVGSCKMESLTTRFFLTKALRAAGYRSYRDAKSRDDAASLMPGAHTDAVVPDMAFSLPDSELPAPPRTTSLAPGRMKVAINVIAYARPGSWPSPNRAVYERYVKEMAETMSSLIERGYVLSVVCSSIGDDDHVVRELLECLEKRSAGRVGREILTPKILSWRDLVASLRGADLLIASRLHCAILGIRSKVPTIAISFDSKVDRMMKDVGQADYLLQIGDFRSNDVINAVDRVKSERSLVMDQFRSYEERNIPLFDAQYAALTSFALASHHHQTSG